MTVCRMRKNKGDGYKRIGDSFRVSGFKASDSYHTTVQKSAAPLLAQNVGFNKPYLVVACGHVVDVPLQNGESWTLGGYLNEMGGSKRRTLGVYLKSKVMHVRHAYMVQ